MSIDLDKVVGYYGAYPVFDEPAEDGEGVRRFYRKGPRKLDLPEGAKLSKAPAES